MILITGAQYEKMNKDLECKHYDEADVSVRGQHYDTADLNDDELSK